jgi:hypothetical protein
MTNYLKDQTPANLRNIDHSTPEIVQISDTCSNLVLGDRDVERKIWVVDQVEDYNT